MWEQSIYEELLSDLSAPNNHTIPAEITPPEHHSLLIMPELNHFTWVHSGKWDDPLVLMDVVYQLVEGVEYLHSLHIAHLDFCPGNVVSAGSRSAKLYPGVIKNRLYIIDFGSARRFELGPGSQPAITLPGAQFEPPEGLKHFDPYSWDVYCLGQTLDHGIGANFRDDGKATPHWLIQRYIRWLIGNERGCTGVCHCRPTARTALRVATLLRWILRAEGAYRWITDTLSRLFSRRS
ncbi:hypothetical protein C8Q77DRAFT_1108850 [Trametes polyzona]|nr:hypothetical protein C8Q77DRAFT_1108850 [Trametes polyzona]